MSLVKLATRNPRPEPSARRVAVVLNGNARAVTERVIRDLRELLSDDPGSLYVSRSLDQAQFIARHIINRRYDVVLSGGGDGTFCQVVSDIAALKPRRMPSVGVLRLGTGNALAGALGASRSDIGGLAADLGRARLWAADTDLNLLRVEGRLAPFAGTGLDSMILSDYNATKRSVENTPLRDLLQGGPGYALAIATRSLWRFTLQKLPSVIIRNEGAPAQRIDLEGRPIGAPVPRGGVLYDGPVAIAAASTIPFYGLGLRLFPQSDLRKDRFQLRVANVGALSVLPRLPSLFAGTFNDPRVHDFFCTAVTIRVRRPAPFQIGGDEVGQKEAIHVGMSRVRAIRGPGLPLLPDNVVALPHRAA